MRARRPRGDRGETLVEVTMSVLILGIAVVALLGGLVTAVMMSDVHRKQARAQAYARNFAETVERNVQSADGYQTCAPRDHYQFGYAPGTGFTATVDTIEYWNGSAFVATCGTDTGVQRLTLRVASVGDSRVAETLQLVIRKPCGTGSTCV